MVRIMEFYALAGKMALGSRLRRLADSLTFEAGQIYEFYGVTIDPKWFPVFYTLSNVEEASITAIAKDIGHTHPSVSNIVKEMVSKNIVTVAKSEDDSRVTIVKLSAKGKKISLKAEAQYLDVTQAVAQLQTEAQVDLFKAVEKIEIQLERQSFFDRVRSERRSRENDHIEIIEYSSKYRSQFSALNIAWIEEHWEMEEADYSALNDPEEYILKPGGYIFLALYNKEVVGTCAMLNKGNATFELAKMAVTPKAKGRGIGFLLGSLVIEKAELLQAERIYLESNTLLEPAINLYKKLGFQKSHGVTSPYDRCNIQMELKIQKS
ncbi:MAG: DNA-binding MarR family transcriptional regulator [Flavobacteriaceae bacterium]|jgi:DNA-binding MarR family transcriptional regulator